MQEFVELRSNQDSGVILLTTTEDLYYFQDDIFDFFSETKGERFTVLIDLFLRNGFSFNRFVLLSYDGKEKCRSFVFNPREVNDDIKYVTRQYLRNHVDLLQNSALSQKAISFVIN
ncbi:MAG: type II toxin-antitoxin system RnlB family antitoxin [Lachnospiraceae bacterium]